MKFLRILIATVAIFTGSYIQANPLDYDIIYVRYPLGDQSDPNNPEFIRIPQGEKAYRIAPSADLVLLKADGTEEILVDCDNTCSVYDPYISYDATTVYYVLIDQFGEFGGEDQATRGLLYKIHLDEQPYTPIQLTFDEPFDSYKYAGNSLGGDNLADAHRNIRDMAPVPLEDGRLLFTSNRAGLVGFNALSDEVLANSVQELWVMDDHEGELNTRELANMRKLDEGTLHMAQHPMQLKDGRILFTTWQDAGTRFQYAMSPLFTIHPDGTNLQQFTEPHNRQKFLDHFITQLPNEDVVWALYYPSFDYGFGVIAKAPIGTGNKNSPPDYLRNSINQRWTWGDQNKASKREFDRKGTVIMTPHTTPRDVPAPDRSGKYSYPSVAKNGNLLVAYSTGSVNWFDQVCVDMGQCEALASGIYMIPNAMSNIITDPNQLIKIKDDLAYNEIFPRAVVPYQDIYGIPKPNHIPVDRNNTMGATAIVGTSSMLNRESAPRNDIYRQNFGEKNGRENAHGNWTIQGADAGIYSDDEIWGVRILKTPHKVFTDPISQSQDTARFNEVLPYHTSPTSTNQIVARYGSVHDERWEIIGEFPLTHTASTDAQGNRDTSWKALIPADTPTLIQAINDRGMTLNSELTWRGLKAGEKRVDCGGCHIHSGEGLSYATTQSGQDAPITGITGIANNDPRIQNSIWDLTTGSIPVVAEQGEIEFINQRALDVEFFRDIEPIITSTCAGCHDGVTQSPDLSMTGGALWTELTRTIPDIVQQSVYIRAQQARASLLTWIIYNERLDGRTNSTWNDDVDYPTNHPTMNLTTAQKRTITRWIDLGNPIDFPNETSGFQYTADASLPVVTDVTPITTTFNDHYHVGIIDADSGINWSTLEVIYYNTTTPQTEVTVSIDQATLVDEFDVLHVPYSSILLPQGTEYVLRVTIEDNVGNQQSHAVRLVKE